MAKVALRAPKIAVNALEGTRNDFKKPVSALMLTNVPIRVVIMFLKGQSWHQ